MFSIRLFLYIRKLNSPGAKAVGAAVALEAVSLADVAPLHHLQNPLHSAVSETVPAAAVAVEEGPALQLRIFVQTVMDTTIDNAGKTCRADRRSASLQNAGRIHVHQARQHVLNGVQQSAPEAFHSCSACTLDIAIVKFSLTLWSRGSTYQQQTQEKVGRSAVKEGENVNKVTQKSQLSRYENSSRGCFVL